MKRKPFFIGDTFSGSGRNALVYRVPESYEKLVIKSIAIVPNSELANNGGALVRWFETTEEYAYTDNSINNAQLITTTPGDSQTESVFLGTRIKFDNTVEVSGGVNFVVEIDHGNVFDAETAITVIAEKVEK